MRFAYYLTLIMYEKIAIVALVAILFIFEVIKYFCKTEQFYQATHDTYKKFRRFDMICFFIFLSSLVVCYICRQCFYNIWS